MPMPIGKQASVIFAVVMLSNGQLSDNTLADEPSPQQLQARNQLEPEARQGNRFQERPAAKRFSDEPEDYRDDSSPGLGVIVSATPGAGVLVIDAIAESPADRAGLQHGDYILAVDGQKVSSPMQLKRALKEIGDSGEAPYRIPQVSLTVWRQGSQARLDVTLAKEASEPPASHKAWLGVVLAPSRDEQGGVAIEDVFRGGPADQADLRVGDVIVQIEDAAPTSIEEFIACIQDKGPGDEVQVVIRRGRERRTVPLQLGYIDEALMSWLREAFRADGDHPSMPINASIQLIAQRGRVDRYQPGRRGFDQRSWSSPRGLSPRQDWWNPSSPYSGRLPYSYYSPYRSFRSPYYMYQNRPYYYGGFYGYGPRTGLRTGPNLGLYWY